MPRLKTTEQLATDRCAEAIERLRTDARDIVDLLQLAGLSMLDVCSVSASLDRTIADCMKANAEARTYATP